MASLKLIQELELELLDHLNAVCMDNHAAYSMIGGTMLGAIRHKGFIPWDDDIDVFMNIRDFKRVKKKLSNDRFFLQTPSTDIQMPFAMYKLRLNQTQMLEPGMESLKMHQGIWIDIFVFMNAGKTKRAINMQSKLFLFLKSYRCRYLNRNTQTSRKFHKILTVLPRFLQLFFDNTLLKLIQCFGSKKSQQYFALDVGKYCLYPRAFFDELAYYQFENKSFSGPKDYDGFLTYVFGQDYMVPRKWGHLPDYSDVIIDTRRL